MIKLREFRIEDSSALQRILNIPEVYQFLSSKIPTPYTEKDANWWITSGSKIGIIRAIESEGALIGCIGINQGDFEYHRSGEIGYWLAPEYWGKGIATQAINEIVDYTFKSTNIVRIFGAVFSENLASQALLAKCGFTLEAVLKQAIYKNNRFYHKHIYTKLTPDYAEPEKSQT